jgi:hypothetical protein
MHLFTSAGFDANGEIAIGVEMTSDIPRGDC